MLQYLMYDGHGSTRALLDEVAAIVQQAGGPQQLFTYDAYGNLVGPSDVFVQQINAALTSLLYSGEQTDVSTALQYLRARPYDTVTGTFLRLDPFAGNFEVPQSLHKYLYTHADPVNGVDPSGEAISLLAGIGLVAFAVFTAALFDTLYFGSAITFKPDRDKIDSAVDILQQAQINQSYKIQAKSVIKEVVPYVGGYWGQVRAFSIYEILLVEPLLAEVNEVFVASTILHETVHTFQFPIYGATLGEYEAWQVQSDFLRSEGIRGLTIDEVRAHPKFKNTSKRYLDDLVAGFTLYGVKNPAVIPNP